MKDFAVFVLLCFLVRHSVASLPVGRICIECVKHRFDLVLTVRQKEKTGKKEQDRVSLAYILFDRFIALDLNI